MNILKRDNSEVLFNKEKIVIAISKANKESINKVDNRIISVIADDIEKNCLNLGRVVSVEEVQDMVEDALLHLGFHDVAKKYVKYRYARSLARKSNTTDAKILSLIRGINEEAKEENSNKDPIINSVQRDYLAGEVSRDITNRYFLTEEVKKAHEDGIIHFHDTDYFISSEFNCFRRDTKFITIDGVRSFNDFNNGDVIKVFAKDNSYNDATVRSYGIKSMNSVTFTYCRNGISTGTTSTVVCTPDHRWFLISGEVTTSLKVGDRVPDTSTDAEYPEGSYWVVSSMEYSGEYEAWCVEEPITTSFTLFSGIVTGNCCLVNLEDMLNNGTVISETLIEKPKTFSTACNIATQIIAQVASNQYGGQSISLTHLAPFVQITREKIRKDVEEELNPVRYELGESFDVLLDDIVERRVRAEIKKGVQTIQYQVITLMTTNG